MSEERRGEVRVNSVNLINYSAEDREEFPEQVVFVALGTARTLDISASGCRLRTTSQIPNGIELTFDQKLADYIVHCRGRVVRVVEEEPERSWDVGVVFLDLDETAQDGIRNYLSFKEDAAGGE